MFSHVCHGLAELNKRVEQTPCEVLGETLLKMVETMTQQFCCMSMCFLFESPFFPGQTAFFAVPRAIPVCMRRQPSIAMPCQCSSTGNSETRLVEFRIWRQLVIGVSDIYPVIHHVI